ncbi:MAG: hypothetical protein D4R56_00195 [Deltaproteobacteria bacterium]|nr:MAG: hypothetical protein D4R56_00195 [Deltaproteobacteria bacterium]
MYLTSFIHRNALFNIAERWFCNCPEPGDVRSLTEILICDGFVLNETLAALINRLLDMTCRRPFCQKSIRSKGELRDIICSDDTNAEPRVEELLRQYRENPDYYYREAPINGVVCLDKHNHLLGSFRLKRPKRIAEKANRKIANWIFEKVIGRAQEMARDRAQLSGVPLDRFVTSAEEMLKEFLEAEEFIAGSFRDGSIRFDKAASTIHDVGAIKIVAERDELQQIEKALMQTQDIRIIERADTSGKYKATKLILEIEWDAAYVCQRYLESRAWERYLDRGIPEEDLKRGLDRFLVDAEPKINIEVILSTFPDMVESEFGNSIHEERIIAQRDNKSYRGYIPMNVEFLVESLFVVGFSPRIDIDQVPIKLWGRYLPETLSSYVRQLHNLPEHDLTH